jgi:hypothetical protein
MAWTMEPSNLVSFSFVIFKPRLKNLNLNETILLSFVQIIFYFPCHIIMKRQTLLAGKTKFWCALQCSCGMGQAWHAMVSPNSRDVGHARPRLCLFWWHSMPQHHYKKPVASYWWAGGSTPAMVFCHAITRYYRGGNTHNIYFWFMVVLGFLYQFGEGVIWSSTQTLPVLTDLGKGSTLWTPPLLLWTVTIGVSYLSLILYRTHIQ